MDPVLKNRGFMGNFTLGININLSPTPPPDPFFVHRRADVRKHLPFHTPNPHSLVDPGLKPRKQVHESRVF
ncbi:hypothetical protein QJS10_CPA09g01372 [Acorus calamus]|uniref:Uncharacterized protein n=1 Tax=Acorus calamus TaxID=4465 RepID=A0AAV9E4Q6_ACOCL|nr:hypothetical protein QJS10_CPA09g01372 [Acorus calamus]